MPGTEDGTRFVSGFVSENTISKMDDEGASTEVSETDKSCTSSISMQDSVSQEWQEHACVAQISGAEPSPCACTS